MKKEAKCKVCGCTDSHACPGGCYWIILNRVKGEGVCSNCKDKK